MPKMAHDMLNKSILFYSEPKKNVKTAKNDSFSIFREFFFAFFASQGIILHLSLKIHGNPTKNVKLLTFFVISTKEK